MYKKSSCEKLVFSFKSMTLFSYSFSFFLAIFEGFCSMHDKTEKISYSTVKSQANNVFAILWKKQECIYLSNEFDKLSFKSLSKIVQRFLQENYKYWKSNENV